MKTRACSSILSATLFALTVPASVLGQEQHQSAGGETSQRVAAKNHHHYKLIDTGTLGGSNSSLGFEGERDMNNNGTVVSLADTSIPGISHAVKWRDGVLTDLGALPPINSSGPLWISDSGLVVGFSTNGEIDPLTGSPEFRAALFTDGKVVNLGNFGGNESTAFGANNRGLVVGCATTATPDPLNVCLNAPQQSRAFLWKDGEMKDLGTLGGADALAELVNNGGEVAGWSLIDSPIPIQHLFLWKNGKMRDLGNIGGTVGTVINDLNNRGDIVGQMNVIGDQLFHPFLWDGDTLRDLGTLGGDVGSANSLNEPAEVVGWTLTENDAAAHAFLWRKGLMIDLGSLGNDPISVAFAINSPSQIVGGTMDNNGNWLRAFVWDKGSMADLNSLIPPDPSVQLTVALGINERGEIAVQGVLANTETHAFVLIPCDQGHPDAEGCDYSLVEATSAAQRLAAANQSNQVPKALLQRLHTRRFGIRRPVNGR
jgi:probable HAF family extracellular repeat protein